MLGLYCGLALLASLAGGWLPMLFRPTHTRLQVSTSLVAGLMLGVGLLHMLPHAWFHLKSIDRVAIWMTIGFLIMFFIQRFFHFHHHDVPDEDPESCGNSCACGHNHNEPASPTSSPVHHPHDHTLADKSARHLSWVGAAFGLSLHTMIDGFALAAAVQAEAAAGAHGVFLGLGTFLVVFLHKPFDALAVSTLMTLHQESKISRHLVNAGLALLIPVGVAGFYLGASMLSGESSAFMGAALAFSAGTFLCIAASDLLPELQFHSHDRVKLSVAMLLGVGISMAIGNFETTGHEHLQKSGQAGQEQSGHDHETPGHKH